MLLLHIPMIMQSIKSNQQHMVPWQPVVFVVKIEVVSYYWRVSEASETLSGVTQLKIGDVCLYVTVYRKTGYNAACVNI